MMVPSGIVLPGRGPLPVREVKPGLYVVLNAYEYDAGYFNQSPLDVNKDAQHTPALCTVETTEVTPDDQ